MPNFSRFTPRRAPALLLLPLFAVACVDGSPTLPAPVDPPSVAVPALQCAVDVRAGTMTCAPPSAQRLAVAANRIIGGQDVNVKLVNTGGSYDSGTEIFRINVTLQNLTRQALGTDGITDSGIEVFFTEEPVAQPSGTVTIVNPTGEAFFTAADQPYFLYPQVLQPYEISAPQPWDFSVPPSVTRFTFVVYVRAPLPNEMIPLLDRVWTGTVDSQWELDGNWHDGVAPVSSSSVAVQPDSMIASPNMPVLSTDAEITHLLVGGGSTFDLDGFVLTAQGNVDAPGTILDGRLRLTGATALLRGFVPSLEVTGSTHLQGATVASGPVSVADGKLTVSGSTPLSISIP